MERSLWKLRKMSFQHDSKYSFNMIVNILNLNIVGTLQKLEIKITDLQFSILN